jgi:hypothetical protein
LTCHYSGCLLAAAVFLAPGFGLGVLGTEGVADTPVGGVSLTVESDEWTESRRYMGLEILAACRKSARPAIGQDNTSEAELTVEAIPA